MKNFFKWVRILFFVGILAAGFYYLNKYSQETATLKEIIARLQADSRAAQVLVTAVEYDEAAKKTYTTIKFLEFNARGKALEPRYFKFSGNIIQFQSLVIRFDDIHVRHGDKLRGKSVYLFMKAFMLDGKNTQVFEITKTQEVPQGYKVDGGGSQFEKKLWEEFWRYALDPKAAQKLGIKNAQLEAPGVIFIPGTIYTIRIEHDGGLRIDTQPLPEILKGEKIK